jgi:hypothetical protein
MQGRISRRRSSGKMPTSGWLKESDSRLFMYMAKARVRPLRSMLAKHTTFSDELLERANHTAHRVADSLLRSCSVCITRYSQYSDPTLKHQYSLSIVKGDTIDIAE